MSAFAIEDKCWHDQTITKEIFMHNCRGEAVLKLEVRMKVSAQFNGNYKSGQEVLEEEAVQEVLTSLPQYARIEVEDVRIHNFELLDLERDDQ